MSSVHQLFFCCRHHKVNIAYTIYPDGIKLDLAQKSPIFILHGLFGSKANWHSVAKQIASLTQRQVSHSNTTDTQRRKDYSPSRRN